MTMILTGVAHLCSLLLKFLIKKKFVLEILIVGTLAIGNLARAADTCSRVFPDTKKIAYHVGEPVKSEDFPAPKYSVFFLGQGSYGQVNRIVNNEEGTSFVVKFYKSSWVLKHDQRMLAFLRKQNPEKYGIRIVKELGQLDRSTMSFEDVRGITLEEAVAKKVLPAEEMKELLDNLLSFQKAIIAGLQGNIFSVGRLSFYKVKTGDFPEGIPELFATVGFMGKDKILLKSDNILLDETGQLVIIDPN